LGKTTPLYGGPNEGDQTPAKGVAHKKKVGIHLIRRQMKRENKNELNDKTKNKLISEGKKPVPEG